MDSDVTVLLDQKVPSGYEPLVEKMFPTASTLNTYKSLHTEFTHNIYQHNGGIQNEYG